MPMPRARSPKIDNDGRCLSGPGARIDFADQLRHRTKVMSVHAPALASGGPQLARFRSNLRHWLLALVLIGLVFVAYARVLNCGFIWDDEAHVTQNPCVIGPLGLKEIWTSTRAVYYPLVLTTFWALHKFVGLNPLPYHILNVLMHAGSAVLLWRLLRQLGVHGAWLGAALWALHPVIVQSVAWVTELKNTQSCLFYLLSIIFFLRWEGQARVTRIVRVKTTLMFALSLTCFVLATLS